MTAPIYFHKQEQGHAPNIYRLIGRGEDALTYALGHLMAVDDGFMLDVMKEVGVLERIQGKRYASYRVSYSVYLQEQRDVGANGRRDIVIEAGGADGLRVVIEAKIGRGQPDACQLLRYTVGCDCGKHLPEGPQQVSGDQCKKFIVALTRDPLDSNVSREVTDRLRGSGIELHPAQWHQILEVVLDRQRQLPSQSWRSLYLTEFVNFFKEHYEMNVYDAEVMVQDEDHVNAPIYFNGCMYVGGSRWSKMPLYFAPYFTQSCIRDRALPQVTTDGISYVSRVVRVQQISLHDLRQNPSAAVNPEVQRHAHWKRWRQGLEDIRQRESREGWGAADDSVWLYFLSEPAALGRTVKKPKGLTRLAPGSKTTFLRLLTSDVLSEEPTP